MADGTQIVAVAAVASHNLAQNLVLTQRGYVPANLVVTTGLVAWARTHGRSWDDIGLGSRRAPTGLVIGVLVGAAAVGLLSRAARDRRLLSTFDDTRFGSTPSEKWFNALVRFPIGTALYEEVAFRGVLPSLLVGGGMRPLRAEVAAAGLFGLWHVIPTWQAVEYRSIEPVARSRRVGIALGGAILSALAGLGLSLLRRLAGTLAAPWSAHALVNSGAYLISLRRRVS